MVEELKIIADILKGVTDGALYGIVFYMVIDLLKPVLVTGIVAATIYKIAKCVCAAIRGEQNVIKFENLKDS